MHRSLNAGVAAAILLKVAVAAAAPEPPAAQALSPLPRDLPARCEELARAFSTATRPSELAAHVSVANCLAEVAMDQVSVSPDDASIARLNAAAAPSLALLDGVIGAGDPYWAAIAQDAKQDLYVAMMVRERVSVRDGDRAARNALEARLAPWAADASRAAAAIADLARSSPELAKRDTVIAGVIGRAEQRRDLARASR